MLSRALTHAFPFARRFPVAVSMDIVALNAEIQEQSKLLKSLKLENADPARVAEVSQRLGQLKRTLGNVRPDAVTSKTEDKKKERLLLKTPKVSMMHAHQTTFPDPSAMQGTRDYGPGEMFCREHIERIVKDCFTTFGGSCLDTPVFERKDVLTDKYGEDAKLIYDLLDQGGEQLALRYDHTVCCTRITYLERTNCSSIRFP